MKDKHGAATGKEATDGDMPDTATAMLKAEIGRAHV